jgi:hypothetical protein
MATQEFNEVVRGHQLQSVRFINRALERSCVNHAPEVKDCSGGARRGNLPVGGELVVGESTRTMDSDTAPPATTGTRSECHVDQVGFDLRSDRPERRGGAVAQHRAMAARQNRPHPMPSPGQPSVSDGVDASVKAMQPSRCDAPGHPVLAEAEGIELRRR